MKIQPMHYNYTRKQRMALESDSAHPNSYTKGKLGTRDRKFNNDGYNMSFSGGLCNGSATAANSFLDKCLNSETFHWLTEYTGLHNVASAALAGLLLAGVLRPMLTIALPGKDDTKDKITAACHSLSSALVGFGFSTAVTTPIDSGLRYLYEDAHKIRKEDFDKLEKEEADNYLLKYKGAKNPFRSLENGLTIVSDKVDKIYEKKHALFKEKDMHKKLVLQKEIHALEKLVNGLDISMHNVTEWGIAIPRAMLTIAMIAPLMNYLFPNSNKGSQKSVQPETNVQNNNVGQNVEKQLVHDMKKNLLGGNK